MKGPDCDAEIAEARGAAGRGFALAADHAYELPHSTHARRLIVYERRAAGGSSALVTDANDERFRGLLEMLTGRGVRRHGRALIAGGKFVAETLARHPDRALGWITTPDGSPPPALASGLAHLRLAPTLFGRLDVAGTRAPLLEVAVPAFPAWSDAEPWPEGCTLFVPFQDPENVGAVVRTAAAFGVARVVLLREAAHPFHPKAARAAGPAVFDVPFADGPPVAELRVESAPLLALSGDGDDLAGAAWPERFGLVVGVEGPGLPDAVRAAAHRLRIPIAPAVESLNAAAAAAIALYAWRRAVGPPG